MKNWLQAVIWVIAFAIMLWWLGCAPAKEPIKERAYFTPATKLDTLKHRLHLKQLQERRLYIQEQKDGK